MKKSRAVGKSLKGYEITNLLFFLVLIIALGVLVSFVFRYYGTRNQQPSEENVIGVIDVALSDGSDMGLFYLDTRLSETTRQYRSRLEIPATDDGLVRQLFDLPGVEEVTVDQQTIILKKNGSARWDAIESRVRQIVKNHLHTHF